MVKKMRFRDFPGGPVAKTPSSNAAGAGLIPVGWARSPQCLVPKMSKQKTENVTNSVTTLKNDPHPKKSSERGKFQIIFNYKLLFYI